MQVIFKQVGQNKKKKRKMPTKPSMQKTKMMLTSKQKLFTKKLKQSTLPNQNGYYDD